MAEIDSNELQDSVNTDNINGIGQKYFFLDTNKLNGDLARVTFGSVWKHPFAEQSSLQAGNFGAGPVQIANANPIDYATINQNFYSSNISFGASADTGQIIGDLSFGAIATTECTSAPYVAHHQSIKFEANLSIYNPSDSYDVGNQCGECGFGEDIITILGGTSTSWGLGMTPYEAIDYYQSYETGYEYSSMRDPGEGSSTTGADNVTSVEGAGEIASTFRDCFFEVDTPFNEQDIEIFETSDTDGVTNESPIAGNVSFEYGDYIESIEALTETLQEVDIVNMYLVLFAGNTDRIIGLGPVLDYLLGNLNSSSANFIQSVATGYSTIMVPAESVTTIRQMSSYKDYFPLRAEISFSTSQTAEIASALRDSSLDARMLRWVTEKYIESSTVQNLATSFEKSISENGTVLVTEDFSINEIRSYDLFDWIRTDSTFLYGDMLSSAFVGRENYSISLASSAIPSQSSITAAHLAFQGQLKDLLKEKNRTYQDIVLGVKPHQETILYKVSKFAKDDFGTGNDDQVEITKMIMAGDVAPMQNIWFANSDTEDMISYIDTQAKYDKAYIYFVTAFVMTIGSKYFYSSLNLAGYDQYSPNSGLGYSGLGMMSDDVTSFLMGALERQAETPPAGWSTDLLATDPYQTYPSTTAGVLDYAWDTNNKFYLTDSGLSKCDAELAVTTMPTAMIYEVPFFLYEGRIMDKPPRAPDVRIIPIKGVSDQITFFFNDTAGVDELEEPFIINPEEREIFEGIKKAQGRYDGLISFGTDDPAQFYEVYRLESMPSKYEDFSGNLITSVSTDYDLATPQKADSAVYTDNISANTKYYYTFRSVDIHGHFSNPSSVFEIEIVSDDGVSIPSIRPIEIGQESHKDNFKNFKKMIHVVPRITQAVVNESMSGITDDDTTAVGVNKTNGPVLGLEKESIWGQTFKIRLVSKKTRRKIDINVTFGTEHTIGVEAPPVVITATTQTPTTVVGNPVAPSSLLP